MTRAIGARLGERGGAVAGSKRGFRRWAGLPVMQAAAQLAPADGVMSAGVVAS